IRLLSRSKRPTPGGSSHSTTSTSGSCVDGGRCPLLKVVRRVSSERSDRCFAHWNATHDSPTSSPSHAGATSNTFILTPTFDPRIDNHDRVRHQQDNRPSPRQE